MEGLYDRMKIHNKYLGYFLTLISFLSVFSMLRIFRSPFNPSYIGYFFGAFIAIFLLLVYLYEVYYCGGGYSRGTLNFKKPYRFFLHIVHFFGYWIFGIYGVSEYGNVMFGSLNSVSKYVYLAGEAGSKANRCRYSMILVDMHDATNRERYCSFSKEFSNIKKIEPLDKYDQARVVNVIYRKSFLGSELIKLEY
jgi:hypothetical protein